MATVVQTNPTLRDVAHNIGTNSKAGAMINVLSTRMDVLDDAAVFEANNGTHNKTSVTTGLPKGTWRRLNYGVMPEKASRAVVQDSAGQLTSYSQIDKTLYELQAENAKQWRMEEDASFIEGMGQNVIETLFYGSLTENIGKFNGLALRYGALIDPETGVAPPNARNIIDAGGTGNNNASIWLVQWGKEKAHMFYPQGTKAGFSSEDHGQVTLKDVNGGQYEGMETYFEWNVGLTVRDWRSVVRIANIDVTALKSDASTGANLIDLLDDALAMLGPEGASRTAIYMPMKVYQALKKQITNFKNTNLTLEDFRGDGRRKVAAWDGKPIRVVEQLLTTEARVV